MPSKDGFLCGPTGIILAQLLDENEFLAEVAFMFTVGLEDQVIEMKKLSVH